MKQPKARKLKMLPLKQIQEILRNHWDPLDIKDEPHAQDEYNDHAMHIFSLMQKGTELNVD